MDTLFAAQVIRKLIDAQDVENYLSDLPTAWQKIGHNIAACPNSPYLRAQAFEASIAQLPEDDEIRRTVFAADLNAELCQAKPSQETDLDEEIDIPKLPNACQASRQEGNSACEWLDSYIRFSQTWSPRGFEWFHESCGLWILSTVAARRVAYHMGKLRFTPLYIALTARTSLFSKSTTASIATAVLERAGLDFFLMPDYSTPQKFLTEMRTVLPEDFSEMDEIYRSRALSKVAFAGQRGWYFDEFGQGIAAMMRRDGPMSDFRGLLRRFDDTLERYECGTIGRGSDVIDRPYLSMLASLTPADIAPYAKSGSALWGDGFLGRYALVTPPRGTKCQGRFPSGERIIPDELIAPLQAWHKRLGIPQVELSIEKVGKEDKGARFQRAHVRPPEPVVLDIPPEVFESYYTYDECLREIAANGTIDDLDGNYVRFSEKALRCSALIASMCGSESIQMNHWARALAVTERWRNGLHQLYSQINTPRVTEEAVDEERVLYVIRKYKGTTARKIQQHTRLSIKQVQSILDGLVQAEIVIKSHEGRTNRYYYIDDIESVEL